MTAQTQAKRSRQKAIVNNASFDSTVPPISSDKIKLFNIAVQMKKSGLADSFIVNSVKTALEFEGVSDLMHLWADEKDRNEKDEIIADIQEMIDACVKKEKSEEIYIKFNDLEAIAKNVRVFKDSLYQKVIERGGISKLAELTGISQPSLSRFFNSMAMPQRGTVLKIAKALDLDGVKMDILWSK